MCEEHSPDGPKPFEDTDNVNIGTVPEDVLLSCIADRARDIHRFKRTRLERILLNLSLERPEVVLLAISPGSAASHRLEPTQLAKVKSHAEQQLAGLIQQQAEQQAVLRRAERINQLRALAAKRPLCVLQLLHCGAAINLDGCQVTDDERQNLRFFATSVAKQIELRRGMSLEVMSLIISLRLER